MNDLALPEKISKEEEIYEKEISYLEGRLTTLELIESGCFYTIVSNEGVEAYV